ncbi:RNA polymerase sigma factor (plasmid) [Glycocaulis abyssi]|uniref:RNA polymerase sigma factor n=1 Tax=Glycocaulis abyssi TaxID=1433403 RepID=A0ABV9NEW0_9PROT
MSGAFRTGEAGAPDAGAAADMRPAAGARLSRPDAPSGPGEGRAAGAAPDGDDRPLAALYRDQYAHFLRFAAIRTGSESDAQDIVQDAFLDIGRAYPDKPADELRKLLFTAIRNKSANLAAAARSRAARRSVDIGSVQDVLPETGAPNAEQNVIDRELVSLVDEIVGGMKPRRRRILHLHRLDGLTYDEIADQLGISPSSVKYNLAQAVATLARQLKRRIRD